MLAPATGRLSLHDFTLADLGQYKREGSLSPGITDHAVFYVGRDNVHGILCHLFERVALSLYLNMYGYDDDELNQKVWASVKDSFVTTMITLDSSQAGGAHEKGLLVADEKDDLATFNTHFAIGQSATGRITHTKGGVLDGRVWFEGSTNWSPDGEGIFPAGKNAPAAAQNNTLTVGTNAVICAEFTAELVREHMDAQKRTAVKVARGG